MNYIVIIFSFISTFLSTRYLISYSIKKGVLDIPNDRSSHTVPTPRGGGIGIVLGYLFSLAGLSFLVIDVNVYLALCISGIIVALIGYIDDHKHVDAKIRIAFHFIAAVIIVSFIGGIPKLEVLNYEINFNIFSHIIAVLLCVWLLNLYNFMDGIDGLAGSEGTVSTLVMGLLIIIVFQDFELAILHFALALSCLGFLLWNYPPAKIFMGDAGSGFLGLMLAGLMLYSGNKDEALFWAWLIMLGVFIVDATYTLIRRVMRGEKPHEAHRSHAYQYASRKFKSHKKVTNAVIFINLFWLAPLATLTVLKVLPGFMALILAYSLLVMLTVKYRAGEKEL